MGLCLSPTCRTLRVPTYEMTCLTRFNLQRAGSIRITLAQLSYQYSPRRLIRREYVFHTQ